MKTMDHFVMKVGILTYRYTVYPGVEKIFYFLGPQENIRFFASY